MSGNCKTPGAVYKISVTASEIVCRVAMPSEFRDDTRLMFAIGIDPLKNRIHDGMEEAIAPLFKRCSHSRSAPFDGSVKCTKCGNVL
jgi:hypothetical protein